MNRARSIWCVLGVLSVLAGSSACGSSPTSPTALVMVAGRYVMSITIWDGTPPALLGALYTPCVGATESASIEANAVLTQEGSRWRARPETAGDGTFDLALEAGSSLFSATGTLAGTVSASARLGSARSVRIGDGVVASRVDGVAGVQAPAQGSLVSGVTFFLGSQSFTCGANTARWGLR